MCLKMGYTPNYSHLVGIMISKTIGCRGTLFSDKPIYGIGTSNKSVPESWPLICRMVIYGYGSRLMTCETTEFSSFFFEYLVAHPTNGLSVA